MSRAARSYHHGNLRDALIIAAAELIEERGSLDFSITDAAKRAGVSNAAPYRHFKDKEDLLDNVRQLAFMGLRCALEDTNASGTQPPGSTEAIISMGHCYLRYARDKRAFFALMWEDRGQMSEVRDGINSKMEGFFVLVNAVGSFLKERGHPTGAVDNRGLAMAPVTVATQLWAIAHGLATLEANNMLDLFDRSATAEKLLAESTRALLAGLRLDAAKSAATDNGVLHSQTELPL